jgi:hypothetical protein
VRLRPFGQATVLRQRLQGLTFQQSSATDGQQLFVTLTDADILAEAFKDQLGPAADFMRGRTRAGYLWIFEDLPTPGPPM